MNPTRLALIIALVALVAPTLRYAVSFQAAEPDLELFGLALPISSITGLAIALSYEGAAFLGLHTAIQTWQYERRHKIKKRAWYYPAIGASSQILIGILIVAPVLVANLRGAALGDLLSYPLAWAWSVLVVAATPLSLATLALALAVQKQEKSRDNAKVRRRQTASVAPMRIESPELLQMPRIDANDNGNAPHRCPYCGVECESASHVGAHVRWHCETAVQNAVEAGRI